MVRKNQKENEICDTWKLNEIQTSMSTNKVLLAHSPIIQVHIISVVFQQQSHDSDSLAHKA